jgi:hypothetical protein
VILSGSAVAAGSGQSCTAHCDCPQGEFCYYGQCILDPHMPVYCCTNPGCIPGRWCFSPDGSKGTCSESPDYTCQTACDCGPGYACLEVPGVGNTCVKDADDPWNPGPSIFGVVVPEGEPTYCCSDPTCHAGCFAYGSDPGFACYDPSNNTVRDYCVGKVCFYSGDCDPGESCLDTRRGSTAVIGTSCSQEGGYCASNAVAEAVYGASSADLIPACSLGCFPGQRCEIGWRSGGSHAIQRVTGICGSCGNGACDEWESPVTCPADCTCGDGICSGTEILSAGCPADCGTCGDSTCTFPETPKNCPSDCQVTSGDGSCSSIETTSGNPQDCGCPDSSSYWDYPAMCGDGVCQKGGEIPETHLNCSMDCKDATPPTISYTLTPLTPDGYEGWYRSDVTLTWSVLEGESPGSLVVSGCENQNLTVDQAQVNYSCTAESDGGTSGPQVVTIQRDATPPIVSVSGVTDGAEYPLGAVPVANCSTSDALSGLFSEATLTVSGGVSPGVGEFTVTCSGAADRAGNQAEDVHVSYRVVFDFNGFFPPVDNPNMVNNVKAGAAVPVKFSLGGDYGLNILSLGSPSTVPVACDLWSSLDPVEETITAGSSSLSYDALTNQYVYVWKTSKVWAGTCRQLQIQLSDGKTYLANFMFTH